MGREVRRVPLDFNWPLNKVWKGFINPHYIRCPQCQEGTGATAEQYALETLVRRIMIAGEDSLQRPDQDHIDLVKRTFAAQPTSPRGRLWPHPYLAEMGIYDPGPNFHEITTGLAGRAPSSFGFGHDSCDVWSATKKILEAAGLPEDWGTCKHCGGHGIDPEVKEAYDAWESYGPPEGEGWQLWETVSEGSPITPVFATAEELAHWISTGGGRPLSGTPTYKEALAFVKGPGWAPSGVFTAEHGFEGGLEHMARVAAEEE